MFLGNFSSGGVAVAVLLSLMTVGAPGCRAARSGESQEVLPELKLEQVRFRVHRGEALRLVGEAGSVSLRRDSTELVARDLLATVPQAGGALRVTAPVGDGVVSAERYSAGGGVTVSRGDDVIRTERARWEPGESGGRLVGDDPVVVEGRGYRLEGTGFALDPVASELAIRGDARLVAGPGVGR